MARRGRLHAYETLDPHRTALIVIDLDRGSRAREPELTAGAIELINQVARRLRDAGGQVAFVMSYISTAEELTPNLAAQTLSACRFCGGERS